MLILPLFFSLLLHRFTKIFYLHFPWRLKLKKVGKTTRQFRYDLNQIPNDYTVEVRNRFKGLDLIECLVNYGWRGSWHCTGDRDKDHPQEKEMQKGKMAVWGGLTNSYEKNRSECQMGNSDLLIQKLIAFYKTNTFHHNEKCYISWANIS